MPLGDSYPKVRRHLIKALSAGFSQYGFKQFKSKGCFVRERGEVCDVVFFTKMRSNSITVIYGLTETPIPEDWQPSARHGQHLDNQAFYGCRYVDRVEDNVAKIMAAFEREALPWYEQFQ